MSLVPPMMRFYVWLHADFGDFICRKGWSCEDLGSLSMRQALQDGVGWAKYEPHTRAHTPSHHPLW